MIIKKRRQTGPVLVVLLLCAAFATPLVTGYSLVIPFTKLDTAEAPKYHLLPGDTVSIFSKFDFSKDKWAAYIVTERPGLKSLHAEIKTHSCLKTTDVKLLNRMKRSWVFTVTNSGNVPTNSQFYLFKNGALVFESGIVLSSFNQGLQSKQYGWMQPVQPVQMLNVAKRFKADYWPVVVL